MSPTGTAELPYSAVRRPGADPGVSEDPGFTVPVAVAAARRSNSKRTPSCSKPWSSSAWRWWVEHPGGPAAGRPGVVRWFGPGPCCLLPLVRPSGLILRRGAVTSVWVRGTAASRGGVAWPGLASAARRAHGLAGCFPTSPGHLDAHVVVPSSSAGPCAVRSVDGLAVVVTGPRPAARVLGSGARRRVVATLGSSGPGDARNRSVRIFDPFREPVSGSVVATRRAPLPRLGGSGDRSRQSRGLFSSDLRSVLTRLAVHC